MLMEKKPTMLVKDLRKAIKGKPSECVVKIQVGDKVYRARADITMTNLAGTVIRLVADEADYGIEEPIK